MPLIFFILLSLFSNFVFADYPAPIVYKTSPQYGASEHSSVLEVCDAVKSFKGYYATIICNTSNVASTPQGKSMPIFATYKIQQGQTLTDEIPEVGFVQQLCLGSDLSNGESFGQVTCKSNSTTPPPPCQAGCNGACGSSVVMSGTIPNLLCIDSCNYGWRDAIESTDGSLVVYVGSNKGSKCTVSPTPPAPPPLPCPMCDCLRNGQSYGTVNGAVVCTAKGSTGSQPTKTQSEGKTTTTTPAPTPENPNPVPVVTVEPPVIVTTTPPPFGSPAGTPPTVSTSESKADGSTTQTDQDKDSFCEQNPNSAMCKTQTLCKDNPNLLICKQTDIDQLCKEHPDRAECMSAEDLLGKPSDLPDEDLQEKEVNIGEDYSFNPVSMPENATCPPPQSISMYGSTMTVSFDWLCQYASAFRLLLKAFATFLAYGIVAAAIRGDSQPYQRGLF